MINKNYDDCYFSEENGYLESEYVFVDGNGLKDRFKDRLNIGETGFGTGLNLLVLEDSIEKVADKLNLTGLELIFTTIEKYPVIPELVKTSLERLPEVTKMSLDRHLRLYGELYDSLKNGWNRLELKREWGTLKINLFNGDVMDAFSDYSGLNNAWFLDGHSPDKNPEMWSEELFKNIWEKSTPDATFATFTAAGIVKSGLRNAGFFVRRRKGFGRKRHMILGFKIIDNS